MTDVAEIARGMTKAQREMASGLYDPEFASSSDAAVLERLGLWQWLGRTDDEEFYHFDITPLGLAVRDYLKEQG